MRTRFSRLIFCFLLSSGCWAQSVPGQEDWIIAVRRAGVAEFISSATLQTVARIHFSLATHSSGLNGVFASADGSMLYIEGPSPVVAGSPDPGGCCSLYSVDLATLQTRMVASIWGSHSREAVVISEGFVYPAAALTAGASIRNMGDDQLHLSPDQKLVLGVRNFRGPALDVYDLAREEIVRSLTPRGDETYLWSTGIWSRDRFYFYAATSDGKGRLWALTPEAAQLGQGVAIRALPGGGCTEGSLTGIAPAGDHLFLYETFGGKLDRRRQCGEQMSGGAWIVDPTSGRLLNQVAPSLHLSQLISNRTGSELYGVTSGHSDSQEPVTLIRIDAQTGQVLQSRTLETDYWWVITAQLKVVPAGDVQARF